MVLGLTMAEVVLLILFTLLLVLSALLIDKEREQAKLAAQIALVEKEFSNLVNDQISDPKKFFQELVIAKDRAAQADRLEKQLKEATKQNAELKTALEKEGGKRSVQGHKWPPIINLSEAGGYYFDVGSAELSEEFKAALVDKVAPKILQIVSRCRCY